MSCCEGPPPGFGAAAAGGGFRPPRMDFGGTNPATRTGTMVNLKTETDDGNLEVLQQSQMQNEAMASQSSCQTKPSIAGNKNVSPAKGPYKRFRVDATKAASPGVNTSNTEDLCSCKKLKGLGKEGKLEDNEGSTILRPPTPINSFEDECVFCHSFRTSEFHGPIVQYRNGRIVSNIDGNPTNTIYVHSKCMYWAPKVYVNDNIIVNVEKEISRASRLKCSRCRLPGAALGCYHEPCAQKYHVPCARMMLPECRWDVENLHVLCPKHASDPLPCDEMSSPKMKTNIPLPIFQNHMEDKQMNPLVSPDSLLSQHLDTQRMYVIHRSEDQQVDQPNTSSSFSLPQGQCSDKEGISAGCWIEEKEKNQSRAHVNQWVLLGSVLSASEKDSLKEFASLTRSTLVEEWDKNVTHVIVGRSASNACGESYEVLMAILSGKWVVRAGWIVDCLVELIPGPKTCLAEPITVPEISYEVEFFYASHTSIDGPKRGRAGAAKGAPKLFSGLHFCLSEYMNPEVRENMKNLIAAGEGRVLEGMGPHLLQEHLDKNPAKVYFICVASPPRDSASILSVAKEAMEYAALGAQVIFHLWLFDAIAAYDVRMLERSDASTPDVYVKTAR